MKTISKRTEKLLKKRHLDADSIIHLCKGQNIRILSSKDKEYPKRLAGIPNPPRFLYVRGNVKALKKDGVAIIGARESSDQGNDMAHYLGKELSNDYTIISGLALGIDKNAHEGALAGGGITIAVVIDVLKITPVAHTGLAGRILNSNGTLVSERSPTHPVMGSWRKQFMLRNRIQAGLALGSIFVEGKAVSGSTNHVNHALSQGKKVYAFKPSRNDIRDLNTEGSTYLINSNKATRFKSMQDLLL